MQAEILKENGFDFLTIKIPISKRPSSSGKTTIISSTNGNLPTNLTIDGKPVIIGLNAYIK